MNKLEGEPKMEEMKCKSCMESIELVKIKHPRTGGSDEEDLWIMCECKGQNISNPRNLSFPEPWVEVRKD